MPLECAPWGLSTWVLGGDSLDGAGKTFTAEYAEYAEDFLACCPMQPLGVKNIWLLTNSSLKDL